MTASQGQLSHPLFARLWTVMSAHETEDLTRMRQANLAGLTGRVLEVGAGTGTNFAHYPDTVTQVVAVEPEVHLVDHAKAAAAAAPVPVTVHGQAVETLADPEPFDAVVCSLVLCTVAEPDGVLAQLFSQLRPGGELRYLEHIASEGWRGRLQRFADATVWPRISGNCHSHRHTEQSIRAAGFTIETARREWTLPSWVPLPVAEFALGRAVRPTT
ncbi:class I SAM-dependent methyltransferase [[Mycobacterium] burgundiense]|uniref:Class I SAM-dependent methyltransferase n=1 Tax=[Mycobacterium] burgundiense TaxID=3064286 RepID=A0ABM9LFG4_9MYCO|nr:class I SAM-dependent methyltransferase [Mycolicibacterium sp. MU0053]CAJ1498117.1 class I SAM-dependent methyltransferase [Mycolicibacterium sp. MU0053]